MSVAEVESIQLGGGLESAGGSLGRDVLRRLVRSPVAIIVVGVLQRGRAGAALLAVDDDEVGPRALVQRGLAEGEHVGPAPDAQLDAYRLAARHLPHPRHERHQLARGAEGGVGIG